MTRSFDTVILGGEPDALVAAIVLAGHGRKVLVVESEHEFGGTLREIEFAAGYRAAPLAPDVSHVRPEILRLAGLDLSAQQASRPPQHTVESLKRFSATDAERWPAFCEQIAQQAAFLDELYGAEPPRIDADSISEYLRLAQLGRNYRALGEQGMIELLRTLPMAVADLLDDWFESPQLKGWLAALAVTDVPRGPVSGGTAFTLLHHQIGAARGVFGERLRLKSGPGALTDALVNRARAAGVTLQTDSPVRRILASDYRVTGVLLHSGEEISCTTALSALNPYRTLLELLDPVHLDPEFIHAVRNIRFRGVTTKVLLALEDVPAGVADPTVIAPSVQYVERAYDAIKYGKCSDEPVLQMHFPSERVAVLHIQYTPYALRDSNWDAMRDPVADRALAIVERHIPGFTSRIRARLVLAPPDLESRFGLREGAVSQGEMMLDQILFMRPVPGASRYATPISGLYLCGAGTHPGHGITGASGLLAARAILK